MKERTNVVFVILIAFCGYIFAQKSAKVSSSKLSPIKVVLVGDSTVAIQGGWGPGFCAHLTEAVDCVDLAANGRSTKSFIDEGLWEKALQLKGQFYFIQFGHNDQKAQSSLHTDPETTFKSNLEKYISDVRQIGATPVLVTSLSRRNYKDGHLIELVGSFGIVHPLSEYASATREVANNQKVPLIDLYESSRELLGKMTQEQADEFDATSNGDAKSEGATASIPDRTHLNGLGKETFGAMVARLAAHSVHILSPYISEGVRKRQLGN
jgi:lysophospholipase L1-like esterase